MPSRLQFAPVTQCGLSLSCQGFPRTPPRKSTRDNAQKVNHERGKKQARARGGGGGGKCDIRFQRDAPHAPSAQQLGAAQTLQMTLHAAGAWVRVIGHDAACPQRWSHQCRYDGDRHSGHAGRMPNPRGRRRLSVLVLVLGWVLIGWTPPPEALIDAPLVPQPQG